MAWIVGDSFDYYNGNADLAHSVWDNIPTAPDIQSNGRFSPGQCIHHSGLGVNDVLVKNFGSNEPTVYVAFAWIAEAAASGTNPMCTIRLTDGGTNQCSVTFDSDYAIRVRAGGGSGTVLATYSAAVSQTLWTHFQIQVVINNTTGAITIRKNGAPTAAFTATGLNTRGGTANNYANGIVFGNSTVMSWAWRLDDVLCFSGAGAAPNTWVGDIRAFCLPAVNDTAQKNFATFPATLSNSFGHVAGTSVCAQAANTVLFSGPYLPAKSSPVSKINITPSTAYTGKIKAALYLNDGPGGGPGTLIGSTPEAVNLSTAGADFPFAAPVPVSAAKSYYLAYLIDTTWPGNNGYGNTGSTVYALAQTYAGGFPASAAAATVTATNMFLPGFATQPSGYNCAFVGEALANGDTDYVFDSTVGDADLYAVDTLPTTGIAAIIGVVSKIYVKKSDAGTRQGQILVKSGATQVAGTDTALSTSYSYLARVDPTDPATGTTWTVSGVNALQVGQKVTL